MLLLASDATTFWMWEFAESYQKQDDEIESRVLTLLFFSSQKKCLDSTTKKNLDPSDHFIAAVTPCAGIKKDLLWWKENILLVYNISWSATHLYGY